MRLQGFFINKETKKVYTERMFHKVRSCLYDILLVKRKFDDFFKEDFCVLIFTGGGFSLTYYDISQSNNIKYKYFDLRTHRRYKILKEMYYNLSDDEVERININEEFYKTLMCLADDYVLTYREKIGCPKVS